MSHDTENNMSENLANGLGYISYDILQYVRRYGHLFGAQEFGRIAYYSYPVKLLKGWYKSYTYNWLSVCLNRLSICLDKKQSSNLRAQLQWPSDE